MNLHSGMITSVECRFCFVFSRKSKPGAKRVKSTNYKNFDPIFWPEKNHTHLKLEHPQRWEAYQRLSAVKKFVYFEITIPFANTIVSYVDTEKYALTFFLYQSIVEILIWDMLWSPDDVDSQTHDNAMRIFVHDLELDNFSTTAKTPLALKMTVKYAGIGLSLRQTALALQIVKDTACVSKIGGMNELKVATFIRIQCTAVKADRRNEVYLPKNIYHTLAHHVFGYVLAKATPPCHQCSLQQIFARAPSPRVKISIACCNAWWIVNAATTMISKSIHTIVMLLQGQRLTLSKQEFQVHKLIVDLMVTIDVQRDSTNHANLDPATNVVCWRWYASLTEIIGFMHHLGHFYMIALESLNDLTRDKLHCDQDNNNDWTNTIILTA
ncbi:hypothetical protein AXG93_2931s1340 [Marchantia polymorpha subsp. ruderalis]|uniref:Uncharacterized protein n=1 Tax=Marchantia polymorpha subsp. ruderalis TaxID=1480154 RepID=A0A176VX19_MARPO|nr:hypothetical protein AXG93_2931s1340 [Marchantia polymorpha subsp. ruderalis]